MVGLLKTMTYPVRAAARMLSDRLTENSPKITNPALEQPPATVGQTPNSSPETNVRSSIRVMADRGDFRVAAPQSQEV